MKCIVLGVLGCVLPSCIFSSSYQPRQLRMSPKVAIQLKHIGDDGVLWYAYFRGLFRLCGQEKELVIKPSKLLATVKTNVIENAELLTKNEQAQGLNVLTRPPSSFYFDYFIFPRCTTYDEAFAEQLKRSENNIQQTWEWFEGFFKQDAIVDAVAEYGLLLMKTEQSKTRHRWHVASSRSQVKRLGWHATSSRSQVKRSSRQLIET